VVFGAAFINAPALNCFLHDAQSTMAHAHAAFPLAYGVPSILMWVAAFYLSGMAQNAGRPRGRRRLRRSDIRNARQTPEEVETPQGPGSTIFITPKRWASAKGGVLIDRVCDHVLQLPLSIYLEPAGASPRA